MIRNTACFLPLVSGCCVMLRAGTARVERLPHALPKALAADEEDYCDQWSGSLRKGCRQKFRSNLLWHHVVITPAGDDAIVLESHNMGECGSAGCTVYVFVGQPNGEYAQVLGTHGDVGALERITILRTLTKGHYDIQKTWADGHTKSHYRWNGARYSVH